ncbi:MAG TPA: YdcF family protein [Anaerolineales bacterium]|nr:YdcF family protein [Anaerolineales bacterium]
MPVANVLIEIASALVKALLPGSMLFLLVGVTIGLAFLLTGRGRRPAAVAWLAGLALLYWLLSLPVVPRTLETWLGAGYAPLASAAEAGEARHVVVLTGGGVTLHGLDGTIDVPSTATAYRLLEAERLYHMMGEPVLVLSGGPAGPGADGAPESEAMKADLMARGVPDDKIWLETASPDTHEQAVRVGELLQQEGVEAFVLVTSLPHMRRALGAFVGEGMEPIASAAVHGPSADSSGPAAFLPSAEALAESETAIREVLALVYYALRGWLG